MADDIVTRRAWLSLALCFFALSTITGLFLLGKQDGYDDIAGQARTRNRKGPAGLPRAIFSRANANRKETSLTFDLLVGTELLCTMIDYENLLEVLHTDIRTPIPETTVSKIISLPPFVTVPGVSNIRDLSHGADLRPGLVFRSGNISDITGEGKTILAGKLNISTIYDLRNQGERERAAPPQIDGVEIAWMPYGARPATLNLRDFAGEDKSADGFVKMYMGILEANTPIFSQVFAHIRDQPHEPFLFHCSAGKDRTGVLAAMILLLIDRPHEEIINDYLLTRVGLEHVRENLTHALALHVGTDHLSPEAIGMLELSGVRAHAMAAFLKTFENTYTNVEGFLTSKLGFPSEDVATMRLNLVV